MKLVPIKSLTDIAKGDMLVVTGNHPKGAKTQMHTVQKVKVTDADGTEIILKIKGNLYFNLGMYLDGKSWWVTDVQKLVVEEPEPKGMGVDFNNLRKQATWSYNNLATTLNNAILKTDQWALPNGTTHGQEMNIKGYVLIDAEELEADLANLKMQLSTIAMVYEPDDPNFADVLDGPLVEFNPEADQ